LSSKEGHVLVISKKPIREYVIEIALLFQEGVNTIEIRGNGRFITKAVDLYNIVSSRMKDSIELIDVSIGSDVVKGRIKPYISIRIKRKY